MNSTANAAAPSSYRICRYPAHLIDSWQLPDGTRATLRPVLPQDDELLRDFVAALSRRSRVQRFHAPVNGLSDATLARMTQLDYHHELAFVVTVTHNAEETVVADARYVVEDDGVTAEFAIAVADAWQGRGIGVRALRALDAAACAAGLRWLRGEVLASNAAMLALMRRCGFCVAPHPEDESLLRVETSLQRHAVQPRRRWLARLAKVMLH